MARRSESRRKRKAPSRAEKPYAAIWAVGFLDLMGYRQALLAIGDVPTVERAEIERRFSAVVARREQLVKPLEAYFDRQRRDLSRTTLTAGGPPLSSFMADINVRVTGFSDSVFLESSLADSPNNLLAPLHAVVAASIIALLMNLKEGSPIRGGVEIGFGLRNNGQLYSGATVTAVALEECAKYPRLLVGKNIVATLAGIATDAGTEEGRLARTIQNALYEDPDDGLIGVDFMSAVSRQVYARGFGPDDIGAIWRFANNSRDEFDARGKDKEKGYYDRLTKYLRSRLPIWGVDETL